MPAGDIYLESYSFSDFALTLSGDLEVNSDKDIVILSGYDYLIQEISLIFRSKINPKDYMGRRADGEEGQILGDILKEDILSELQVNDGIDETELFVEVYPLPDNVLKIEIYQETESDETEPIVSASLNFTEGRLEGIERVNPTIDTVYDLDGDAVDTWEILNVVQETSVVQISHIPYGSTTVMIYSTDDIAIDENELITGTEITETTTLYDVELEAPGVFRISEVFPTTIGLGTTKPIGETLIVNELDESMEFTIDGNLVTVHNLKEEYEDLVISITYYNAEAESTSYELEQVESTLQEDQRILFPHDRLVGTEYVYLNNIIQPGKYVAVYQRYPARVVGV